MATLNANLEGYQEQDDFSPVPPGEYLVKVIDSAVREAKTSGNRLAEFAFEIQGPEYRNRKIWDRYVLGNEVAMSRLKTLAKSIGHRNPNFIRDTEELHGGMCRVRVKIEEQNGYEPKNVITSFKPAESAAIRTPEPPGIAPELAAQAQPKKAYPWEKNA
jgi:hypothetical protein